MKLSTLTQSVGVSALRSRRDRAQTEGKVEPTEDTRVKDSLLDV